MKTEFIVSDMTCNHCVQTITRAVLERAPSASVQADVASHRVVVETTDNPMAIEAAIREAGYDVRPA